MSLSPARLRLLVASLFTVSFLGALDNTVVTTALATVAGQFGELEHLSWIVVGYSLASTVGLPVLGKLGDRVGARGVFIASLIVFIAASILCGFAQNMVWLISARVVQGMSSAGLQLMSQTIIAEATSPRQRPKYLALIGAAFPVAILIGPVLGGLITDSWGWPWVFWVNVPVGVAALAFALVAVPHVGSRRRGTFDAWGSVLLTVALVSLVLAVEWSGGGSTAAAVASLFGLSAVAFAAFFVVELRVPDPLVSLRLFKIRTVAAGTAVSAIVGVGLFSITAYLPTYFQMAYRTTATVSGLVPIATVFGMLISNLGTGWLASRTGRYRPFVIAGTATGASGLVVMGFLPVGLPLWAPMLVMFVVGIGTGAFMSLIVAVVQSAAPKEETGSTTATINLVRQVGSTLATAAIGTAIGFGVAGLLPGGVDASTLTPAFVHAADSGLQAQIASIYRNVFAPIFFCLAGTYGVGVIAALLLPRGRLADDHEPVPAARPQPQTA